MSPSPAAPHELRIPGYRRIVDAAPAHIRRELSPSSSESEARHGAGARRRTAIAARLRAAINTSRPYTINNHRYAPSGQRNPADARAPITARYVRSLADVTLFFGRLFRNFIGTLQGRASCQARNDC